MKISDNNVKIMIDAGHYGKYNPSPVVDGYYESITVWKLHEFLTAALEKYGFTVAHTRNDPNSDLAVTSRGKLAKGCDLFLSLHTDACGSEEVDRISVFAAFDDHNNASVLGSRLAAAVAKTMGVVKAYLKTRKSDNGDYDYYGVMRGARSAGCPLYYIIEHSFHTNKRSALWLMDESNLKKLASAEAAVIADYYGVEPENEIIPGDVNGDGKTDLVDYALIKRAVLGKITLTDEQFSFADVDLDGKLTANDYVMVKRVVMGTLDKEALGKRGEKIRRRFAPNETKSPSLLN